MSELQSKGGGEAESAELIVILPEPRIICKS